MEKTYLAAAIANRRIELGHPALFITAADLIDYLRSGFGDEADQPFVDLFEQVRNAPLLVLDDLPTRPSTPWTQERLFQLLASRHAARLPTVVTLRGDPNRLDEFLRTRLESADGFGRVHRLGRADGSTGRSIGAIPSNMRARMTFAAFDPTGNGRLSDHQRRSLQAAKSYVQRWANSPDGWLSLHGPYGVGKTHLAVAAAGEREDRGDEVFFATVADLLDYLRATFAPDSELSHDDLLDRIRNADVLVLDDMGAERSTPSPRTNCSRLWVTGMKSGCPQSSPRRSRSRPSRLPAHASPPACRIPWWSPKCPWRRRLSPWRPAQLTIGSDSRPHRGMMA